MGVVVVVDAAVSVDVVAVVDGDDIVHWKLKLLTMELPNCQKLRWTFEHVLSLVPAAAAVVVVDVVDWSADDCGLWLNQKHHFLQKRKIFISMWLRSERKTRRLKWGS